MRGIQEFVFFLLKAKIIFITYILQVDSPNYALFARLDHWYLNQVTNIIWKINLL